MATVSKPIALDESINTTETPSRNVADVLAQELSGIASAITGGSDKVPKTDVATVEPSNTASRSYSVGELVYVNGNLYKVIASISMGSSFTVGTNIQSTTVSGEIQNIGTLTFVKETASMANGDSGETVTVDLSDVSEIVLLVSFNQNFTYATPHTFPVISNVYMRDYHFINSSSAGAVQVFIDANLQSLTISNTGINESIKVRVYTKK